MNFLKWMIFFWSVFGFAWIVISFVGWETWVVPTIVWRILIVVSITISFIGQCVEWDEERRRRFP